MVVGKGKGRKEGRRQRKTEKTCATNIKLEG